MWSFWRVEDGGSVAWLRSPGSDSIRRYVFDVFVNGTHPLLPWMVFLCAGIVLGRVLGAPDWRLWCGGLGMLLFGLATIVSSLADTAFTDLALSRHPFDRGLVYVASALGTSLVAFAVISWVADRATGPAAVVVELLREAGQMTLTLYIAHILIFNLVVDWLGWVEPGGLTTALTFALGVLAARDRGGCAVAPAVRAGACRAGVSRDRGVTRSACLRGEPAGWG